jgi:hypothetical protein
MRKQSPEAVEREIFRALVEADADTLGMRIKPGR